MDQTISSDRSMYALSVLFQPLLNENSSCLVQSYMTVHPSYIHIYDINLVDMLRHISLTFTYV